MAPKTQPRSVARDAQGDPAFKAGEFLTYPPASWWRSRRGLVAPPTRAKYWTEFSLTRLKQAKPLPGRTRDRAQNAQRAKLAKKWEREQAAALASPKGATEWRIAMAGELVYQKGSGPENVARVNQSSPWQTLTTIPSDDQIQALYWDVCRAAIRGSTGFTSARDNRHGPSWDDSAAPTTSNFLKDFPEGTITYENSNLFPLRVTLHARTRPRPKGLRDQSFTLYAAGKGNSRSRADGGADDLGEDFADDFGAF